MTSIGGEHKSRWPAWAREFSNEVHARLDNMERHIMADQDKLDVDVKALTDGLTAVETEITALKNQPAAAALDFTALDAVVSRLQGEVPAPAPAPAPTPTPTP